MLTWLRSLRRRQHVRGLRRIARPQIEPMEERWLMDGGMAGFVQTPLVSSVPHLAPHTNADLINPWGFAETSDGQFRVAANGAGESLLLKANGTAVGKPVIIATPSDSAPGSVSAPNGVALNTTSDFVFSHGGASAPATFIFSTEDGTIAAYNPKLDNQADIVADLSDSGAVFKLLAPGTNSHGNVLFSTDFHNDRVDIFDKNFQVVGSFTDPGPHAGYAPFGVKDINGVLFVTFAKQDNPSDAHDDAEGVGHGFIDEFTPDGAFIKRFATGSDPELGGTVPLNSPIGMTLAPDNFGPFRSTPSNPVLLVGNFGDSRVNAFNLNTGAFLGQLTDTHGQPLVLNGGFQESNPKGLWGIGFGNGHGGADTNTLFFAAGINAENDGVFGKVSFVSGQHHGNDDGDHDADDRGAGAHHNGDQLLPGVMLNHEQTNAGSSSVMVAVANDSDERQRPRSISHGHSVKFFVGSASPRDHDKDVDHVFSPLSGSH